MNVKYYIGVETSDEEQSAYCLSKHMDGVVEIILSATRADRKAFEEEVRNLAQYFNADIIRES